MVFYDEADSENACMSLWIVVRIALYENYISTEEFLPQFDANVNGITELMDDIPKL